jgi:hypothetical protein
MYANQYGVSVSASYSGRSGGILNSLRTKRLKPLNHISSDRRAMEDEEQDEEQDVEPEAYGRSFTQGPSQSGQGRYQMQTICGPEDEAEEEVLDFDYDRAADADYEEDDDGYDQEGARYTGVKITDSPSRGMGGGGGGGDGSEFISLLNDVNDAIDNLSNVHALLAGSCATVAAAGGASGGRAGAPAPPASASYSPEIAFILSSLCSGGDCLLERISRSNNSSGKWSESAAALLISLLTLICLCLIDWFVCLLVACMQTISSGVWSRS